MIAIIIIIKSFTTGLPLSVLLLLLLLLLWHLMTYGLQSIGWLRLVCSRCMPAGSPGRSTMVWDPGSLALSQRPHRDRCRTQLGGPASCDAQSHPKSRVLNVPEAPKGANTASVLSAHTLPHVVRNYLGGRWPGICVCVLVFPMKDLRRGQRPYAQSAY